MKTTKRCTKCKKDKGLDEFYNKKDGKDGISAICKDCKKQYDADHADERREYHKAYYKANRERVLAKACKWYDDNKERKSEYDKAYAEENKEMIKVRSAEWRKNNRHTLTAKWTERYRNDIEFRLIDKMRKRMRLALNGTLKHASSLELLGCSSEYFRNHIEQQLTKGMTWDNIHVDHILPVSAFNMKFKKHQKYAFHWSNCQPLFAEDNMRKSDSYCPDELAAYLNSKLPTPSL